MHPDDEQIAAFAAGTLDAEALLEVEAHLDRCARCRETASELSRAARPVALSDSEAPTVVDLEEHRVISVGDVVDGRYRVTGVIGTGTQGTVLEALHLHLNQRVALKLLRTPDDRSINRMVREGRAAAQLESPHVCRILDVGKTSSGQAYLAMELLRGETVEARLQRKGLLSESAATAIMVQLLDALSEAHRLGIVHRDIKPANLFLAQTRRGEVLKVLDFGIARSANESIEAGLGQQTRPRTALGTPLFMAPEQFQGSKVDARADIWAVGISCFQMLTGKLPFQGGALFAVRKAVLSQEPPTVRSLQPEVSARLSAIVSRCLEKRPQDRFADGSELAAALSALPRATSAALRHQPTWKRSTVILVAVVVVLAVAAVTWLVARQAGPVAPNEPVLAPPRLG